MDVAQLDRKIAMLCEELAEREQLLSTLLEERERITGAQPADHATKKPAWGSKNTRVRAVIARQKGEFDLSTLLEWFAANDPSVTRNEISFILNGFVKSGEVKVKRPGSVSALAVYENR